MLLSVHSVRSLLGGCKGAGDRDLRVWIGAAAHDHVDITVPRAAGERGKGMAFSNSRRTSAVALGSLLGATLSLPRHAASQGPGSPRSLEGAWAALAAQAYGTSIVSHGADPSGATPSDAALDAAVAAAPSSSGGYGGLVYIPPGRYLFKLPHVISRQRVHVVGAGQWATTLVYRPSDDHTAFLTYSAGASISNECSLRDLTVFSDDATHTKTAIRAVDTSALSVRNVRVTGTVRSLRSLCWGGGRSGSIALHMLGREATDISNFYAYADRPILLDRNPNMSGRQAIDCDHAHFCNLYLYATQHPCIEAVSGLNLTNATFDGYQAWVGGTHGFYWADSASTSVSVNLRFANVRLEQGVDRGAYSFYIARSANMAMLSFLNIRNDPGRRGWFLRNCSDVRLESTVHEGPTLALDVDASVRRLSGTNTFWQAGTTASLGGQKMVWSTPKSFSTAALPPNFVLDEAAGPQLNAETEAHQTGPQLTVPVDGTIELGVSGTVGFLTIDTHENVGAIFHLNGTANTVSRGLESAAGLFSTTKDTPNSVNIYFEAGRYLLQNKRGSSLRLRIGRPGGSFTPL
ncbi:MAG: hypothetical protein KF863_13920 [Rubrivivax sp.]|nr:hypothetical protein [Rubrivivax sp.]